MEDLPGLHLLRKLRHLLIYMSFQTNWKVRIKTIWYIEYICIVKTWKTCIKIFN